MDGYVHQSMQRSKLQPLQKRRKLGVISADPDPIVIKADILFVVVTVLVVLLRYLSSRRSDISRHALGRYFLIGASAAYFSLISYVFSYLTTYLASDLDDPFVLMLVVLLQFLKSNADMAALAVAAVASPTAGDHVDSKKIRPSMESLVSSLWVAGLVIYYMLLAYTKKKNDRPLDYLKLLAYADLSIFLIWALGVARLVLRFVAFEHVNASFAVGRNAELTEGYMAQLQEQEDHLVPVPHLILMGEKKLDVEESPQGYRIKVDKSSHLVTLDKVWSSPHLSPEIKDLCLSFSLFKCLRRQFAGYRLAEAGSDWAFRFVCDGLLGPEDDYMRIFNVISCELSFASDFYYSPLPVASLGARSATLHFFFSVLIFNMIFLMFLLVLLILLWSWRHNRIEDTIMLVLLLFVTMFILFVEMAEMATSVYCNWTKISMVGHYINRTCWSRIICPCLLRFNSPVCWKDEIGQNLLLNCSSLPSANMLKIFLPRNNSYKPVVIKVSLDVKDAIIRSLKKSRGKLNNGVATVQLRCPDLTWTCYDRVTTNTDTILVWYIATSLVEIKCSSPTASISAHIKNMAVATSLSRYCAYLVADVPDLLPDNATWTKHRYQKVKKCIEDVCSRSDPPSTSNLYSHLIEFFGEDNSNNNEMAEIGRSRCGNQLREEEVVKIGSKLGKQLVEEAKRSRDSQGQDQEQRIEGEEAVWEILADFWSEMILYLAPSDNVKGHIEALRRGGELITLLWALLLHAGITSRLDHDDPYP